MEHQPAGWSLHDIIPIGDNDFVARPYGLDDVFKGALDKSTTTYLNIPFTRWMEERGNYLGRI